MLVFACQAFILLCICGSIASICSSIYLVREIVLDIKTRMVVKSETAPGK